MNWFTHYACHTATDRAAALCILPGETGKTSLPGTCSPVDFIIAACMESSVVFSEEELPRVESPLLLLIGGQSLICDPQRVYQPAIGMPPNIEAEIIPDASHALNA